MTTESLPQNSQRIASEIQRRLGSAYKVQRNNPLTYGWTIYHGEDASGGFVWLGKWVHVYGMASASADSQEFVKSTVSGVIGKI